MGECRRTVEQLAPYLDGALPPEQHAEVERHLGGCPPCRRMANGAAGGRAVLRERAEPLRETVLPPGLQSRCEWLCSQHAAARPWWRGLVPALAIVALICATGLAVFQMETRRSSTFLAQQLTLDHIKCFRLFASSSSSRMDARVAENFLLDRYGWDVHVPPSSDADGISLIAARRCLYAAGTIPHLMYRVGNMNVSLFMLEGVTRQEADVMTLGYESRIWSRGATTYVMVAPRAGGDIAKAASYVMKQLH